MSGENIYSPSYWLARIQFIRPVALIGRASDSKSEGWGFESLLACINLFEDYVFKSCRVSGYEWDRCGRVRSSGYGFVSGNC